MNAKQQGEREKGGRPFPWVCPSCGERNVYPASVAYAAEIKYDGLTHAIAIPALEVPQCGSCSELLFDTGADDQIDTAIRSHLKLLTPSQIRSRRKELDLTQKQLAERTGAAEATISRWENGALIQARTNDNLLRVVFGLNEVRRVLVGENQDPGLGIE